MTATPYTLTATFTADESTHTLDTDDIPGHIANELAINFGTGGSDLWGFDDESATIDPESLRVTVARSINPAKSAFDQARSAYWDAQRAFRDVAVSTIAAAIPEGMAYAVFEINDTPRLSLSCYLDADGNEHHDDTDEPWDTIDSIAADAEAFDWDEADSFMPENDTNGRFLIARQEVAS